MAMPASLPLPSSVWCCAKLGLALMSLLAIGPIEGAESTAGDGIGWDAEAESSWRLALVGGAEGSLTIDDRRCHGGRRSFRLTKNNSVGYLLVRPSQPVTIAAGVRYRFSGFYHADDAPLTAALLFRVSKGGEVLFYDSIDLSFGYPSQTLIVNAPERGWERRAVHHRADQDGTVYPTIALYGNPTTIWLDDLEFSAQPFKPVAENGAPFAVPYTADRALEVLRQRRESSACVAVAEGRADLQIDNQPVPPVIYKAEPWYGAIDHAGFAAAGVSIGTVSVHFQPLRGKSGAWLDQGRYDFTGVDLALQAAFNRHPLASVIVDLYIYPYAEWGERHPDEVWADATGKRGYSHLFNLDGFAATLAEVPTQAAGQPWWYPSYQSTAWRDDACQAIGDLIAHLRSTVYWKGIVGFALVGGQDGEFQIMPTRIDQSPANRNAFRRWCRERYQDIASLRAAWSNTLASFDEISLPVAPASGPPEAQPLYLVAGMARDYRDFASDSAWRLREAFAGAVKRAAGKPVVTVVYGAPTQYDFAPLMSCPSIDAGVAMSYYPFRRPGLASGFLPGNSFARHGKLFIQELDLRSWVGSRGQDEVAQQWLGAGEEIGSWRAIQRKLIGVSLAQQAGYWYFDMNHFFNHPAIMAEIHRASDITAALRGSRPSAFHPDVCVARGPDSGGCYAPQFTSASLSEAYQNMAIASAGVPCDVLDLDDVLAQAQACAYKVCIFQRAIALSRLQREQINQLKAGGRTLVWLSDSGFLTERGPSAEALSQVIGMNVRTRDEYARRTTLVDAHADPLTAGVPAFQGMGELLMFSLVSAGATSIAARSQPFWIEDPAATTLATYVETGQAAMAVRRFPEWTSLYLGAPNALDATMLNNLARQAGAYVCGPPGAAELRMNGDFVSLHALRSQTYPFRLPPGRTALVDADSGQDVAVSDGVARITLEAQQTYWFLLR